MKWGERLVAVGIVLLAGITAWAIISEVSAEPDTTRRCLIGSEIIDCGEAK